MCYNKFRVYFSRLSEYNKLKIKGESLESPFAAESDEYVMIIVSGSIVIVSGA